MGTIRIDGSIIVGPPSAVDGFPSMSASAPLALLSQQKQSNVSSGAIQRQLASPSSFATLSGVGAGDTVTKADFLYLQTQSPIRLELTVGDGVGGTEVVEISVVDVQIMNFASLYELQGLRAKGAGAIQYLVSGQS